MRDLFVAIVIFGSLPVILFQPYVGVLVWTWISLMNPHRLAWGFATTFPFAKFVGGATLLASLNPSVPKQFPLTRETVTQALFVFWMLLTTVFALNQEDAWQQWSKVGKIQLVVLVTMMLITTRRRLEWFLWMIVVSIGFYGIKGGVFTITSGGQYHVNGPSGTFIDGNNHLGIALVMVIPLMRYLHHITVNWWVRTGLVVGIVLTAIATLGTQSRGAFLGLCAMMTFLVLRSRHKTLLAGLALLLIPLTFVLMPQEWFDRMDSIRNYEQDRSAMGRLNAWGFAIRLALDRPLLGGGFECFTSQWFALYAPDPTAVHDSHSIYFEVLAEHGFVGILLFLALGWLTWRSCSHLGRKASRDPDTLWLSDLGKMVQVSLVGYAVTGAFVGLAYFDLYYNLVAVVVVAKLLFREHLAEQATGPEMRWNRRLSPATR